MAIFDEKKMEQKPVYPTKRTPSYADWALFNMGKELEESIEGGGGEITVDQEVIAGSENPVAGGAVKTYVDNEVAGVNEVPDSTISDAGRILTVDSNGAAKWEDVENITEQTVVTGSVEPVSGGAVKNYVDTEIGNVNEVPTSSTLDEGKILSVDSNGDATWDDVANVTEQSVVAGSVEPVSGGAVKTYVDTEIGNVNEVPASTSADANKVLTVDSNGNANWQTPISGGLSFHTFTSFSELKSILINQPMFYAFSTANSSVSLSIQGSTIRIILKDVSCSSTNSSIRVGYHDIVDTDSTDITINFERITVSTNNTIVSNPGTFSINISTIYAIY